ncbi:hypothetical protein AB0C24_10060 [Amycolatopsis japonica]|uniref:hypothetical protein n=1 Tax=Amycolatopsis japonica TaxID=208439 RepID=UPI0033E4A2F1
MSVLSRRSLLAGGASTVGTAVAFAATSTATTASGAESVAAPVVNPGCIDLGAEPYNVVAGDESAALANTRAVNRAVGDHRPV